MGYADRTQSKLKFGRLDCDVLIIAGVPITGSGSPPELTGYSGRSQSTFKAARIDCDTLNVAGAPVTGTGGAAPSVTGYSARINGKATYARVEADVVYCGGLAVQAGSGGPIIASILANGGNTWFAGETFTVGSGDAAGVVDTTSPPTYSGTPTAAVIDTFNAVTAVDQGAKTFTEAQNVGDGLAPGVQIQISGSTANDGTYTTASFSVDGITGATTITVVEVIPDATADGFLATPGQISVAGDQTASFTPNMPFVIVGSTGLNGLRHVMLSVFSAGATMIFPTFDNLVNIDVADGTIYTTGAIATYHLTSPGSTYTTASNVPLVAGEFGTGGALNITAA